MWGVRGGVGAGAGRGGGQLLRAGWAFVAGDAVGVAGAVGVRGGVGVCGRCSRRRRRRGWRRGLRVRVRRGWRWCGGSGRSGFRCRLRSGGCGSWRSWRGRVRRTTCRWRCGWRVTLDVAALRAALRDVVGRHEALRTVFPVVDGEPYQRGVGAFGGGWGAARLCGLARVRWRTLVAEETGRGFDLAVEVPLRALAVRRPARMCMCWWWWCITLRVMGGRWGRWRGTCRWRTRRGVRVRRRRGSRCRCSTRITRCGSGSCWVMRVIRAVCCRDRSAYWREALAGAPEELVLPVDRPRPAVASHRGHAARWWCRRRCTRGWRSWRGSEGVTVFMVVQAALAVLLSRLGAGEDIPDRYGGGRAYGSGAG